MLLSVPLHPILFPQQLRQMSGELLVGDDAILPGKTKLLCGQLLALLVQLALLGGNLLALLVELVLLLSQLGLRQRQLRLLL